MENISIQNNSEINEAQKPDNEVAESNDIITDVDELKMSIEAILFSIGDSVEISRLAECLNISEKLTKDLCESLKQEYNIGRRGVELLFLEDSVQLASNPLYYDSLIKLCHVPKKHNLTDVMLETLSIIAYKQPVTRQEIEAIRGVKSDFAINKLLEYNLICELGRKDVPGRPILFGTSEEFLRCFGLCNMDELPIVNEEQKEQFRLEALKESNTSAEEIIMDNL